MTLRFFWLLFVFAMAAYIAFQGYKEGKEGKEVGIMMLWFALIIVLIDVTTVIIFA